MRIKFIKVSLLAFIILLPFSDISFVRQLNYLFHLPGTGRLADYLFLLIFVLSITDIIKQKNNLIKDNFVRLCLLSVIYLFINSLLSLHVRLSGIKFLGKGYLLSIPIVYSLYFKNDREIINLLKCFCFSYFVINFLGLLGILFYYLKLSNPMIGFIGDIPDSWHIPRLYSFFPSPDLLSIFLITGGFLVYYCRIREILNKRIFLSIIVSALICLLFTFSRSTWTLFVGLGIMIFYKSKLFSRDYIGGKILSIGMYCIYALLILSVVLFFSFFYIFPMYTSNDQNVNFYSDNIYSIGKGTFAEKTGLLKIKWFGLNLKLHNRMIVARETWDIFLKHPIKGVGIGVSEAHGYFGPNVKRDAHNTFLTIFSQMGIIGFCLATLFLIIILVRIRRLANINNAHLLEFARAMLAIICTLVGAGLFTDLDDYRYLFLYISLINLKYNEVNC